MTAFLVLEMNFLLIFFNLLHHHLNHKPLPNWLFPNLHQYSLNLPWFLMKESKWIICQFYSINIRTELQSCNFFYSFNSELLLILFAWGLNHGRAVFLIRLYGAPLAQRASYLALHISLFEPVAQLIMIILSLTALTLS